MGMLSNQLLKNHLNAAGYYQCTTTAGLWSHKCRPILFWIIVDDFGVKYIRVVPAPDGIFISILTC